MKPHIVYRNGFWLLWHAAHNWPWPVGVSRDIRMLAEATRRRSAEREERLKARRVKERSR